MAFTAEQKEQYIRDIDTIFTDEKQSKALLNQLKTGLGSIEISDVHDIGRMVEVNQHLKNHLKKSSLAHKPFAPLLEAISTHFSLENLQWLLERALDSHNKALVDSLTSDYLDINAPMPGYDDSGDNMLHCAARSETKLTKALVDVAKANVNAKNKQGNTALHLAAGYEHVSSLEIVQFLQERKADINAQNADDETPLHLAAQNDLKICKFLVSKGADINARATKDKLTPLDYAYRSRKFDIVLWLADELKAHPEKWTALHIAAKMGNKEMLRYLREQKIDLDINARTVRGQTPLHLAVMCADLETCKSLIFLGADINAKDARNRTPLEYAYAKRKFDIVQWLIDDCKVLASHTDKAITTATALHLAAKDGAKDKEMLNYLLDQKANVNAQDSYGRTPLHIAVQHADLDTCKLLVSAGADINIKTVGDFTPLDYAHQIGKTDIFEWLSAVETSTIAEEKAPAPTPVKMETSSNASPRKGKKRKNEENGHKSSNSIKKECSVSTLQGEHSRFPFAGKGAEKEVEQVKAPQPAGPNG